MAVLGSAQPTELRTCVKIDMAVLGSPSLIIIVFMVSVDVKQH